MNPRKILTTLVSAFLLVTLAACQSAGGDSAPTTKLANVSKAALLYDTSLGAIAPKTWSYKSIEAYRSGAAKLSKEGATITTPELGKHQHLVVRLEIATNDGASINAEGDLKFGVQGLSNATTVASSSFYTSTAKIPTEYTTVDFVLKGNDMSTVQIVYAQRLSGIAFGVKHISIYSVKGDYKLRKVGESTNEVDLDTNIQNFSVFSEGALPSVGEPRVLVVPIDFPNRKGNPNRIEDIRITFADTEGKTEWESLKTYYQKSSYGQLDIQVDVVDRWITTSKNSSYYDASNETTMINRQAELIKEVCVALDDEIDFSLYDTNGDMYVDSIYFIYNYNYNYNSVWWAWQYYYWGDELYDDTWIYYYIWASIDFITEEGLYRDTYKYNAHTYIHETGHLFGLADYYDTNPSYGPPNGLTGADMMDYTIGDHNPFSKMLLGWVSPTVVNTDKSVTLDLTSFTETGKFLLLSNDWGGSMFEEYILVEFYTPTGLHAKDKMYRVPGVRVFHVSSDLTMESYQDFDGSYKTSPWFAYDNGRTDYKIIKIIEADGEEHSELFEDSDLFQVGDVFTTSMNNGQPLRYKFKVNAMTDEKATLTISIR